MFRSGRRMFSIASLLLIVVAGLHTAGGLIPPKEQGQATVLQLMDSYKLDAGLSMHPSQLDIFRSVWFTVSFLAVLWALQNLCVAQFGSTELVRLFAILNFIFLLGLDAVCLRYQVPPPLISFGFLTVLFLFAIPVRAQES